MTPLYNLFTAKSYNYTYLHILYIVQCTYTAQCAFILWLKINSSASEVVCKNRRKLANRLANKKVNDPRQFYFLKIDEPQSFKRRGRARKCHFQRTSHKKLTDIWGHVVREIVLQGGPLLPAPHSRQVPTRRLTKQKSEIKKMAKNVVVLSVGDGGKGLWGQPRREYPRRKPRYMSSLNICRR